MYTVPHQLQSCEVSGMCCKFAGVVNQVSTSGDADAMGIRLLWSKINNNPRASNHLVLWNVFNLIVHHDEF
jgi:hypothetical protein